MKKDEAGSIMKKTPEAADPEFVCQTDDSILPGARMCNMTKTLLTKVTQLFNF